MSQYPTHQYPTHQYPASYNAAHYTPAHQPPQQAARFASRRSYRTYTQPREPLDAGAKILLRVLIVGAAVLAILVPGTVAGLSFVQSLETRVVEDRYAVDFALTNIEIVGENAAVHVKETNGDGFVSYRGVSTGEAPVIVTEQTDQAVRVAVDTAQYDSSAVRSLGLTIGIPKGDAHNLKVSTVGGASMVDSGTYGTVDMRTKTGLVEFDAQADSVTASTSSGAVQLTGKTTNVKVDAKSGAINVDGMEVTGSVDLKATVGAVSYTMHPDVQPESIQVAVTSGAVGLELLEPNSEGQHPYRVDVDTTAGPTDVEVKTSRDSDAIPVNVKATTGIVDVEYAQ